MLDNTAIITYYQARIQTFKKGGVHMCMGLITIMYSQQGLEISCCCTIQFQCATVKKGGAHAPPASPPLPTGLIIASLMHILIIAQAS